MNDKELEILAYAATNRFVGSGTNISVAYETVFGVDKSQDHAVRIEYLGALNSVAAQGYLELKQQTGSSRIYQLSSSGVLEAQRQGLAVL
jgi:hypothetical protein